MSPPAPPTPPVLGASTPFLDASAVEAWDAWVRWRCNGELRDLTIEASWERVAAALASAEPHSSVERQTVEDAHEPWRSRFLNAFNRWELLLDLRILRNAGTGDHDWPADGLCAALNVAAFVRDPFTAWARFDGAAFELCAALAVRALDNAIELIGGSAAAVQLNVGLIGFADALALLGQPYASEQALKVVNEVAEGLARGCFLGSSQMALERGTRAPFDAADVALLRRRQMPVERSGSAELNGIRHRGLTTIKPQPRLALLANNVSDALDPLHSVSPWQTIEAPGEARRLQSAGFAQQLRQRLLKRTAAWPGFAPDDAYVPSVAAQIDLRAACVPWIDAPIDYPLCTRAPPDSATLDDWQVRAANAGLPSPCWRLIGNEQGG